jgi:hypothetical protein
MVVLRPTLSRQPAPEKRQAPVEQVLVDLLVENQLIGLMDVTEAHKAAHAVIHSNLLQVATMQRYANSRKLEDIEFLISHPTSLDAL